MSESFLKFAKVRPSATIPTKEKFNAGFDIYADFEKDYMAIKPNETTLVPTGIASALSSDLYLQVHERGSTGSIGMKYSAGVIDSSYRGEIFIAITNCSDKDILISKLPEDETITKYKVSMGYGKEMDEYIKVYPYTKGIAQLIIHRVHNEVPVEEVPYDELKTIPSDRGDGKLGSSGK
ncbi:MAG: dUTP pyrophosphatase [Lachnospiraceae bacterium]|nr:dUTP pyrophosphatase [Lachnospiraceae bacterium]